MTEEEVADRGAPHMTGEEVAERRAKCREALKLGDHVWLYFEEIQREHRPVDAAGHPAWVETVTWRPREWWPDDVNDWGEKENQKRFAEWML
ncbi:hypothetical protein [Actinopolymorpha pittospori]|uniref:Uncharacterized protein n=1 Tax=Actinopolymorpha pittospori TaxID=648752 RepID=A0A927MRX6_9ACTN|nr:hypothetical protein [Actinopolymorpha pittospori]MBE1604118.1 hypothetical protein [Actinopolymorpha pittospori]